ncbi:hypothetical protein L1887_33411 [Cichorium endivia]|nr:hypothetical protein L1887_33411 [Cichorium endivia]
MAMEGRSLEKERDIDDLPKNEANYTALTPLWFLKRAALVHPHHRSVVHSSVQYTWLQTYQRCCRLASALSNHSVGFGSTVAVIAPNILAMYEAHFRVPMSGAVINAVNICSAPFLIWKVEFTYVDYESEVEDDFLPIFQKGEEFHIGVEFILLIAFKDSSLGKAANDAR